MIFDIGTRVFIQRYIAARVIPNELWVTGCGYSAEESGSTDRRTEEV